jgi:hypothetical protein
MRMESDDPETATAVLLSPYITGMSVESLVPDLQMFLVFLAVFHDLNFGFAGLRSLFTSTHFDIRRLSGSNYINLFVCEAGNQ